MLWLRRPPYLRWLAATLVLTFGVLADLTPGTTSPHPFLLTDVTAGTLVTSGMVELRPVPDGLLPRVSLPATAAADLRRGDPLLAAAQPRSVPEGWWAFELVVPAGAEAGREVRVAVSGSGPATVFAGVVAAPPRPDGFDGATALVAVPEEAVPTVATGLATGRVTVLLGG